MSRKYSYVRVEDDYHQGCIWTVFHMLNYHPWNNVRKMLPYKKHKPRGKASKNKGITPEDEHEIISITHELEEDSFMKYSASVNSNTSKNGSTSKRSIKARIKALMKEKNSSTKSDSVLDEPKYQGHKYKSDDNNTAPTLMALLKANPKLIRSVSRIEDSTNILKPPTKSSKKEDEFVGVLELFNVDQDLFIKILQENSPRKPRLVKSGTFPRRNPADFSTKPSKVEHKHTEIWPVSSNVQEFRKAKSQGMTRSSSLTESLGKFGYLFDSSSNKAIKKHLSKSFKSMNEMDFALCGDFQDQRSDLPESKSELLSQFSSERLNRSQEVTVLKVDSTEESENLVESESEEKGNWYVFEDEQIGEETFDEVHSQEGEIDTTECSVSEEIRSMYITSTSFRKREDCGDSIDEFSMEYYNQEIQDLQYVKYVLDIVLENQQEVWQSEYQPLDPALFDGIEVCCPFEPKSDTKSNMSSTHRKLLFDLINEALENIHDKCYVYYPKALSFCCQVRPRRNERIRDVEEVWEFVDGYLSWRPELDPSLDLAVANDLSRYKNGWVNLQMDSESLALELEDWIFDDLLDELTC